MAELARKSDTPLSGAHDLVCGKTATETEGRLRGYHDIGGLPLGEIDRSQHDHAMWERRVDAMLVLLSQKGVVTVDELRWGIETLGADAYEKLGYYERWIASVTKALLARGVITTDELGRRMAAAEGKR
jgi:nitrile hydratase subunit beta